MTSPCRLYRVRTTWLFADKIADGRLPEQLRRGGDNGTAQKSRRKHYTLNEMDRLDLQIAESRRVRRENIGAEVYDFG